MGRRMGRRELKMKNLKLKIAPHFLSLRIPSIRERSLKGLYKFGNSLDVSHLFDMTKSEFLIRKAI